MQNLKGTEKQRQFETETAQYKLTIQQLEKTKERFEKEVFVFYYL